MRCGDMSIGYTGQRSRANVAVAPTSRPLEVPLGLEQVGPQRLQTIADAYEHSDGRRMES